MPTKFIPNGDQDFVTKAESFARTIAGDPAKFEIAQADSEALTQAVTQFRAAFQANRAGARSQIATRAKEDARLATEQIIRRLGNLIRNNVRLDTVTKMAVGIQPRAEKGRILPCPQEPPRLKFERADHQGSGITPMHELSFWSLDWKRTKPDGAVRIELFVDLVPPEEPIPAYPGANHSGRPWYLRSYTRSPIKLIPPMPRVPMRVVYWARWADSLGNVGPFSATAAGWIEGGSHALLPGGVGMAPVSRINSINKPVPILEDSQAAVAAKRDPKYSVAVLDVQYELLNPQEVGELPAPEEREVRQLEGPESEAA